MAYHRLYYLKAKSKPYVKLCGVPEKSSPETNRYKKGHISTCCKVRSTGSKSLFGNRVAFVTPRLFHCTLGINPKLLNYDHKPHMITTHLGDCVVTRVYFFNKVHGVLKGT